MGTKEKIKVGVVGVGRGQGFARGASGLVGMELAALCDSWAEKLEETGRDLKVATYTDYEKFLDRLDTESRPKADSALRRVLTWKGQGGVKTIRRRANE